MLPYCKYIYIIIAVNGSFELHLTLPGMAGIVLNIGMAVRSMLLLLKELGKH